MIESIKQFICFSKSRRMIFKLFAVLLVCGFAAASQYQGYKVYEISPRDQSDSDFLHQISHQEGVDGLHVSRLVDRPAQIMVAPMQQHDFEVSVLSRGLIYEVIVEDVSKKIEEDGIGKQSPRGRSARIAFTQYYRHADINNYLEELARNYPRYATVQEVGKSTEGRAIKIIRITNGDGNPNKKVIFVDAGIHAREWLAPATALYVINQLVENMNANQNLLSAFDWIILPVVNPDGYEFTHTNTRMWRKTRSKQGSCIGTDGNRNFGFHWGEVGASASACSDTFRGPSSFSEPETKIVRDILLSLKGKGKFYLTLHSYGNYILYPWGWTSNLPDTYKDLDEVSVAGANAMRSAGGGKWTYGSSTRVLYAAAGGSDDYAFAEAGFPISITMEVQAGGSGFDPRPAQIDGFVKESWVGIKAMAEKVNAKY